MDNEKSIRVVAKKMLEQSGYTVVLKEEGRQVIEYLTAGHDSVVGVILDLMVPDGMGGLDTVIEIRNIRDDIPVFVTSGDTSNPIMSSPEEYGFTASIAKPFTRAKLAETLNKFMPGSNKPRG
ncbi:MAG: response regulator [Candidatus Marinimicrobia bacterium]|nr:response regulator [Candidatus Neomarinimicrobiota bacterium]